MADSIVLERTIEAPSGWQFLDFKELWRNKDLLAYLVYRDVTVMYAQTILGFVWAIINPLIQIIVFSVIFGRLAGLDSGGYPYFLFSTVAIIPWTYMTNTMSASSQSLISGQAMLGKVYFPRIIFPITPIFARLVDFAISLLLVFAVMAWYGVAPTWNFLYLPVFILMMVLIPAGLGFWMSSLAIRFRDVKFALPFIIRMLIYSAPILYSIDLVPEEYRLWYALNPIVGVIEGFRACFRSRVSRSPRPGSRRPRQVLPARADSRRSPAGVPGYRRPSSVRGSKSTELGPWPLATCVNGWPAPSPGGWSVLKQGALRGPIDALAGPSAVPAVVGLAATGPVALESAAMVP